MPVSTECVKCGEICVLGVNAISTDDGDVCDSCAGVRRGFANRLLPEERKALRETLTADIRERHTKEFREDFTTLMMARALEDAQQ